MIIRYSKERELKNNEKDPYLTLGKDYICLGIVFYGDSSISPQVIVLSDYNEKPCSFDLSCFDFIDPRIPEGWKFSGNERGFCEMFPKEINADFWDNIEAGHEISHVILDAIVRKIKHFHGMKIGENSPQKINNFPDQVI